LERGKLDRCDKGGVRGRLLTKCAAKTTGEGNQVRSRGITDVPAGGKKAGENPATKQGGGLKPQKRGRGQCEVIAKAGVSRAYY